MVSQMICDPNDVKTDFFLFRVGPVIVTSDRSLWEQGTQWLVAERKFEHHPWWLDSEESFYEEVSKTLGWKDQFGYDRWNGNLDALNDGASNCTFPTAQRIVISLDNADRLKSWFGAKERAILDIFQEAAHMQLLFGVGLLVMVYTKSNSEAKRWAKADGVLEIDKTSFPGAQLARDAIGS